MMGTQITSLGFKNYGRLDVADLLKRVRRFDALTRDFTETYGRDLQVLARSEAAFGVKGTRKSFYRPAQEPIYQSLWPQLSQMNFNQFEAVEMASLICGQRVHLRTGRMGGSSPDGRYREFAKNPVPDWPDLIREGERRIDCPIHRAAYRYAHFIEQHPFADGNGRFARALVVGSLAQSEIIRFPSLGLAGAIEVLKIEICEASALFSTTGKIQHMVNCLSSSINLSLILLK